MIDLGTVRPGSTIRIPFSSYDKDDGSSITMTNFAAADILVYKDGSTTERASTSGFTATTDLDGKTGKHVAIIDLADNTTADFYASGSEYLVAIDAVTVDAVTTGGWIARFRIGYVGATLDTTIATLASQTSFTLTSGPAEDDALNGCEVIIHDAASAVQYTRAIIEDYTGSTKTVTLRALPAVTFTIAAKDNVSVMGLRQVDVTHWKGAVAPAMTGDAYARLGAPAGASVSADVAAVKVDTAAILVDTGTTLDARIPAALVGGRMDASVGAMAANVLTAAATASDFGAEVAAAVWDLATSGHTTSGTFGEAMAAAGSAGDPWTTALPGSYTSGQAGKILGDNLNATVSSRAVAGDAMALTSGERTTLAAAIWNAATSGMTTAGSIGKKLADWSIHSAADVWAVATRVLTAATNITSTGGTTVPQTGDSYARLGAPAGASVSADIAAIAAYLDTEIAAILEDTGTTLPAQIAALNNLSAAQVNAEVLDVLATDTAAELAAVPAANASLKAKITFLAMLARNKITQTATTKTVFADDGSTQVAASTVSDDGTTYTRGELA